MNNTVDDPKKKKLLPSAANRYQATVADKGHFRLSTSEFRLPTFDHDSRHVLLYL